MLNTMNSLKRVLNFWASNEKFDFAIIAQFVLERETMSTYKGIMKWIRIFFLNFLN